MGAVGTSGRQQVGWWQLWGGVVHVTRLDLGMVGLLLGLDLDITGWSVEPVGQSGCQEERYYLCVLCTL